MSYSNRKRVHIQKHIFNTTIYLAGTYDSLGAKDSKRRQVSYHQVRLLMLFHFISFYFVNAATSSLELRHSYSLFIQNIRGTIH